VPPQGPRHPDYLAITDGEDVRDRPVAGAAVGHPAGDVMDDRNVIADVFTPASNADLSPGAISADAQLGPEERRNDGRSTCSRRSLRAQAAAASGQPRSRDVQAMSDLAGRLIAC
jgi:hypothetical protein